MNFSKHFSSENYEPIVFSRGNESYATWRTILDVFGLEDADKIVLNEYKIDVEE